MKTTKHVEEPKTLRVKPANGFILAGIPATGTDVDTDLAKEWIANGLVVLIDSEHKPTSSADTKD